MGSSFKLFSVSGIDVKVHITFPLILIWGAIQFGVLNGAGVSGAVFGVVVTLLLFAIVVLHEFGHSYAALYYGVPVKDITLLPIGGVAQLERMPDNPTQEFMVAIAGPAVNFALALIMLLLRGLFGAELGLGTPAALLDQMGTLSVASIFNYMFAANLALGIFNLIPAFPMDGGRVLRALLAMRMPYVRATNIAVTVGQALAWLLGLWGFLGGGFFLVLIAFFVYIGAGQEGQAVRLRGALGNLKVEQAYSRHTRALAADDRLRTAIQLTLTTFQQDFPVVEDGVLVGMLPYARLLEVLNGKGPDAAVRDVMLKGVPTAAPHETLFDVQQRLATDSTQVIPVVEDGLFLGLLTNRDINEVYRLVTSQPDLLISAEAQHAPIRVDA